MMKTSIVIDSLIWQFLLLSLVAIGGANSVLPEMHRQIVDNLGWMDAKEFSELFAVAQVAPGPNVLIVSLIGWKVAGVPGALAATAAMCTPSSLLAFCAGRMLDRLRDSITRIRLQNAIAPITIGLVFASGYLLARGADHNWATWCITLVTVILTVKTSINPLWLLVSGALLGVMGAGE
jgi:chromate transporter